LLVLAALGGGSLWWLLTPGSSHITPANFDRVQRGMTYEEVVGILGRPADDGMTLVSPSGRYFGSVRCCGWWRFRAFGTVIFDDAGRVASVGYEEYDLHDSLRFLWMRTF
jgi:hypothetical protein